MSEPDPWWYRASRRSVLGASFAVTTLTIGLVFLVHPDPHPMAILGIIVGMMLFVPFAHGFAVGMHDDRTGRAGKRQDLERS